MDRWHRYLLHYMLRYSDIPCPDSKLTEAVRLAFILILVYCYKYFHLHRIKLIEVVTFALFGYILDAILGARYTSKSNCNM